MSDETKIYPSFGCDKEKNISGKIEGYIIRQPGADQNPLYCFGKDPEKLKESYYEGFNPVYAMVRVDEAVKMSFPDIKSKPENIAWACPVCSFVYSPSCLECLNCNRPQHERVQRSTTTADTRWVKGEW